MTQFAKKHLIVGVLVGFACVAAIAVGLGVAFSDESSSTGAQDSRSAGTSGVPSSRSYNVASRVGGSTISGKPTQCLNLPDPGECRGAFPRFFYNATSDQCDCFLFGGCEDDPEVPTSWMNLIGCHDTCHPANKEQGPRCKDIIRPQEEIQTFRQPNIVTNPDLSHVNDSALLDLFNAT